MIRPYLKNDGESYEEMLQRLAHEDSNAYGHGARQISCRIRNHVNLSSDILTTEGSDMFYLANEMAFKIRKVYKKIGELKISDKDKVELANAVKEIEESPSHFAATRSKINSERLAAEAARKNRDEEE